MSIESNGTGERTEVARSDRRLWMAFLGGAAIGTLGGLIGLGGAEFRLPLLIGLFGFVALEAVVLNKAMSLVVVAAAMFFRTRAVPLADVMEHWPIVLNLLAGSMFGAWIGADFATRLKAQSLYRVIAMLLVLIALVLVFGHNSSAASEPLSDQAAGEMCPVWPGQPITAHWGVQDPTAIHGPDEAKLALFKKVFRELESRIKIFTSLPLSSLDRVRIKERVDEIGRGTAE